MRWRRALLKKALGAGGAVEGPRQSRGGPYQRLLTAEEGRTCHGAQWPANQVAEQPAKVENLCYFFGQTQLQGKGEEIK